jgi:hypothetical protein
MYARLHGRGNLFSINGRLQAVTGCHDVLNGNEGRSISSQRDHRIGLRRAARRKVAGQ